MVALLVVVAPSYATLAAPNPLSPGSGASVGSVPVFNWSAVSGADHYQFQIAATNTFSPALYSIDTRNTRAALSDVLQNKTYYWRVRAMTATNGGGAWSAVRSVVMAWNPGPLTISSEIGYRFRQRRRRGREPISTRSRVRPSDAIWLACSV